MTNNGNPCGNSSIIIPKSEKTESRTYDCLGYDISSSMCKSLGLGDHVMPGDISIYINCDKVENDYEVECKICKKTTKSCFIETEGKCVENCGIAEPYSCEFYDEKSYPCVTEGYFPHPKESSVYFQCILNGSEWHALCFTCNEEKQSCYNEAIQACLPSDEVPCGESLGKDLIDPDQDVTASLTYTCSGYNNLSFPCSKRGPGMFVKPGDKSVYFECLSQNGKMNGKCHTCDKHNHGCYEEEQGKCVENCGKGPNHKPYNCSTYDHQSFPCEEEDVFANPKDTSIYFKCVKK